MGAWGWTMMLALWGGIGALVVWAIRSGSAGRDRPASSPVEILERRLASGDITRQEYDELRALVESPR
ncbi:MAG: SHOCT domain-containing protein [Acidimicrobiia bacterium]|nr:SHOCT domain-containing protein [Acidimicrobiia bacterium]